MLGEERVVIEGLPAPLAPEGLLAAVELLVAVQLQHEKAREGAVALPARVQLLST